MEKMSLIESLPCWSMPGSAPALPRHRVSPLTPIVARPRDASGEDARASKGAACRLQQAHTPPPRGTTPRRGHRQSATVSQRLLFWAALCVLASCGEGPVTTIDAAPSEGWADAGPRARPERDASTEADGAAPETGSSVPLEVMDFSAASSTVPRRQAVQLHVAARGVPPLHYAFQVISGEGAIAGAGPEATFTAGSMPGNAALTVKVTDGRGRTITAALVIGIVNARPAITAFDAAAPVGKTAQLTAVAADPDGDLLTYHYELVNCSASITGTGPQVALTLGSSGTCEVRLTVRDDLGLSASAATSVAVSNLAPSITSFAPSSASVPREDKVELLLAATDPEGESLSYSYKVLAGSGTVADEDGKTMLRAGTRLGSLRIAVTAADPQGATATAELEVAVVNRPPSITQLMATPVSVVRGGSAVISLSATDPDGSLDTLETRLEFARGSGTLVKDGQVYTFRAGAVGDQVAFNAFVSDGNGGLDKATLYVTLLNAPPTITSLTVAPQRVYEQQPATLTVTAADTEGTSLEYLYELDPASTAGGSLSFAPGTWQRSASVSYTPRQRGEAHITVRVRDADGAISEGAIQKLTVKPATPAIAIMNCDTSCTEIDPYTGRFDFGSVPLRRDSPAASLRLFNAGTKTLLLRDMRFEGGDPGDFSLPQSFFLIPIEPGQSIPLGITVHPEKAGLRGTALAISSNDPERRTVWLAVIATGVESTR